MMMFEEYEKKRRKQVSMMKSLLDYGMGFIILVLGLFFLFRNKLKIPFNESFPPNDIDKIFGVICILYGAWRIYRGYQKKYFR
jgi:hypothetical protein